MTPSPASAIRLVHDERDQVRLSVRGPMDASATAKLAHYLRAVLEAGARFIVLDLSGKSDCDPGVLTLLADTQRELTARAGMITVVGLAVERGEPVPAMGRSLVAV
jgi:ABC-type transporter Mla MlaB component